MLKRFTNILLAIAPGFLCLLAWPDSSLTILIFVAWIPLLILESKVKSRKKFFMLTYVSMLSWNILVTWWIWNASIPGAIAAFLANSLLMCLPWLGFTIVKKWLGERIGYVSLVAFWMCFEYIHLQDWGLSWPWLTLGNVFASHPQWIQWYRYTGTSGGTLWIMLVNVFLYLHLQSNRLKEQRKNYRYLLVAVFLLILPIAVSLFIHADLNLPATKKNIVVVQPNIDPYEKIFTGSFDAQLLKLIHLSENEIDSNTALVIWPETALYMENGIEEDKMKEKNYFLRPLWGFLQRHPNLVLFTGIESYRVFKGKLTPTARLVDDQGDYVDDYNGSVLLDSSGPMAYYHKSKLVPGVETLPWFLRFIDRWFEKFGGTTAGYAKQNERTVLDTRKGFKIAPAICYESIYGEFMTKYIRNGANLICIITNDGWWKNTPGHRQHLNYARLRAIESNLWIARSANTGISCFIDPRGEVLFNQPYNTAAAIKIYNNPANIKTFYVRYGDILSKIMVGLSFLLFCWNFKLKIKSRFFQKKK